MSELITAALAVSILLVAWICVRTGERLSKLENRLRRLERSRGMAPGKVIGAQAEQVEQQETEKSPAAPS